MDIMMANGGGRGQLWSVHATMTRGLLLGLGCVASDQGQLVLALQFSWFDRGASIEPEP
ncbi:hypothetical protein ACE10Z_24275 [Bradyrhizobium sp. Pha-3]|uniref:hypothetical protein n=1 Tax=Bradyrhizobium sp. Pha-3 TaxID=208375 RepID=UPI0035D4905A